MTEQTQDAAGAGDAGGQVSDPLRIADQREFRQALKELRERRGITLKQLEVKTDRQGSKRLTSPTVSTTLKADDLPDWDFVAAYVTACGVTGEGLQRWERAWDAVRKGTAPVEPDATVSAPPMPPSEPDGRWRQRAGGWVRTRRGLVACGAAATAMVLAAAIGGWQIHTRHVQAQRDHDKQVQDEAFERKHCGSRNTSLMTHAGECTGVTDGQDGAGVFGTGLEPVLTALDAENRQTVKDGNFVTIGFLAPLTSRGKQKDLTLDQFVGEIEGAYTAVERANESDSHPKIRLVLANMGSGEERWEHAVDGLKAEKGLVAVVGMGLSQQQSVDAARALSKVGIPMVADLITADGFDSTGAIDPRGPINGLVRIAMPNRDQLTALGRNLDTGPHTVALIGSDVTPTGGSDLYTKSLDHGFRTIPSLSKYLDDDSPDFPFSPQGGADAAMPSISQNLCRGADSIDVVYYAARAKYLPTFLEALRHRSCYKKPITVVTGSDAAALDPGMKALHDPEAPITLMYASFPSPAGLAAATNRDHGLYTGFVQAFVSDHHGLRFPADHLKGSYWPVLAHDAVLTATTAIHTATANTNGHTPNRYDVTNQLYTLGNEAVPAATGRLGINRHGNRTNLPVTVHTVPTPN
ncbi:helix-turn-helix transcriptional regulator [Streptomyces sp. ID05-04B]|uniref:helix-turn-helix transcriptional regulator n=1 Tax=Streptomyces sp. ID05-04B TaxID=3028661 RepID=UPI0029C325A7|nr:helix-turn-helix transcriptional regulator [Streptomyces sp. ID05-04B]MDX5570036.1 helix-turn-helix transcriptional regulator [Streptomyces sp. ID05-04B]